MDSTGSSLNFLRPISGGSYTGQIIFGTAYVFSRVVEILVVNPVCYVGSALGSRVSKAVRFIGLTKSQVAVIPARPELSCSKSQQEPSPINASQSSLAGSLGTASQHSIVVSDDPSLGTLPAYLASQNPEEKIRLPLRHLSPMDEASELMICDSETEDCTDESDDEGSTSLAPSSLLSLNVPKASMTLAMRQLHDRRQTISHARPVSVMERFLPTTSLRYLDVMASMPVAVLTPVVSPEMSLALKSQGMPDTAEALTVSENVTQVLMEGLQETDYTNMSGVLSRYLIAVGFFVRECGEELSPVQQRILRNGLVDLLARYQMLENDQEGIEKRLVGIRGGKRAMALKVNKLQQIREALHNHNWQSATQISGIVNNGIHAATRIHMVDCSSQKELTELVLKTGMNIDMFSALGKQKDIDDARDRMERKQEELNAELSKSAADRNQEKENALRKSLDSRKKVLRDREKELADKQKEFRAGDVCHLDELYLQASTEQERMRREALPEAFETFVGKTPRKKNKDKYYSPALVVKNAEGLLRAASKTKVGGHQTLEGTVFDDEEMERRVTEDLEQRMEKLRCGYNEMLLNMLGAEAFCKLEHVAKMTDKERGILRDHLMRNCPVNIPLQHKDVVFRVAQDSGNIGQGACKMMDFVKDLEFATSPYKAPLMVVLAQQEPETFTRLLSAVKPDDLTPEELEANYKGCQALFVNTKVGGALKEGKLGEYGVTVQAVLPDLPRQPFVDAEAELKQNLKNMRRDDATGTDQTPPDVTKIPFPKYKEFDFSCPRMQLLMAISYGYYTITGVEVAMMQGDLDESDVAKRNVRAAAKNLLVGVGQELLINGQPELGDGKYFQTLLFGEQAVPGMCLVNADNFQPRVVWYIREQLRQRQEEASKPDDTPA